MNDIDCHELYANADWYDQLTNGFSADLPLYRRLAGENGGPILELACGTGRIALDLAARGYTITGLDISPAMLQKARQKQSQTAQNIEWILSDMRAFNLNRIYRLIILGFNSICHIHDRLSLEGMFRCVLNHMDDESRFVVAMFVPDFTFLCRNPSDRFPVGRRNHFDTGDVMVFETNTYDPATQINHITWYYQVPGCTEEIAVRNNMRMFFPQEFHTYLHYNGFTIDTVYGDYDSRSFSNASKMQIYVLRKTESIPNGQ
jgi:SAM-dependent methyltransferase